MPDCEGVSYYRNTYSRRYDKPTRYYPRGTTYIHNDEYYFELIRELPNNSGLFDVYAQRYYFTSNLGVYNREMDSINERIVILNIDLSKTADGEKIGLKKNQTLYKIGIIKNPQNGRKYKVYSYKKDLKIYNPFLSHKICPHCNGTGKLPPK
jgi:hypothetical protein